MKGIILRRLLQLPLIVGAVFLITLALAWGIPGNPLENPAARRPPFDPGAQRQTVLRIGLQDVYPPICWLDPRFGS